MVAAVYSRSKAASHVPGLVDPTPGRLGVDDRDHGVLTIQLDRSPFKLEVDLTMQSPWWRRILRFSFFFFPRVSTGR